MIRLPVLALAGALSALVACSPQQAVQQGFVSPMAQGILPYNQDLTKIVRGTENGCYYEMMDGSVRGYLSPVQNPYHAGKQVCDPVVAAQ